MLQVDGCPSMQLHACNAASHGCSARTAERARTRDLASILVGIAAVA
jgi:hypothetical protein